MYKSSPHRHYSCHFESWRRAAIFAASVALAGTPAALSQGFSGTMGLGSAKTVGIKQLLPATVNLNQKHIKIESVTDIAHANELATILKTKLVTMIQKDPRFIVDEAHPQTILRFTITNSYTEERHYTMGAGSATQNCTGFTGKLEVSYQALDAANQAPLDSENLVASIADQQHTSGSVWNPLHMAARGACGTSARETLHEAQDQLVDEIVHQMGQRAAPTETTIVVKLPGKKLESLSRLAMAQRWGTLEEDAEKADKLPKPEDDAYRLYLIALAKEAQAYDLAREAAKREDGSRTDITEQQADESFRKAMALIDEARKLYKDALQAKPGEKEFQEPDNRMEKAVNIYATITRHKDEYKKAVQLQAEQQAKLKKSADDAKNAAPHKSAPVAAVTATSDAGAGSPLDQIVKFCQQGIAFDTITDYIKDPSFISDAKASGYKFNFKTDPLTLRTNCQEKADSIGKLMRQRLSGATPVRKPATSTSTSKPVALNK